MHFDRLSLLALCRTLRLDRLPALCALRAESSPSAPSFPRSPTPLPPVPSACRSYAPPDTNCRLRPLLTPQPPSLVLLYHAMVYWQPIPPAMCFSIDYPCSHSVAHSRSTACPPSVPCVLNRPLFSALAHSTTFCTLCLSLVRSARYALTVAPFPHAPPPPFCFCITHWFTRIASLPPCAF